VNRTSWLIANFLSFMLLLMVSAGLQSSLLHWFFHWMLGWRLTINFALVILVYISLYRNAPEALLFVALGCYVTGLMSVMLASINVFTGVVVFFLVRALRTRVYSSSPVYFTWTALGAIFAFHLIAWITSEAFEAHTPSPHPLDWILEVLMTALVARVVFATCIWLDIKTKRSTAPELTQ
jgi:hypothetical protein